MKPHGQPGGGCSRKRHETPYASAMVVRVATPNPIRTPVVASGPLRSPAACALVFHAIRGRNLPEIEHVARFLDAKSP